MARRLGVLSPLSTNTRSANWFSRFQVVYSLAAVCSIWAAWATRSAAEFKTTHPQGFFQGHFQIKIVAGFEQLYLIG
jgi:hypothetical protein